MSGGETNLHILFEHAAGYTAFKIREFEEESMFISEVEECISDYSRFKAIASLIAFTPFKTAQEASDNLKDLSEGKLPEDLKLFISELGVKKLVLGVGESKVGGAISEAFPKVKVRFSPLIQEVTRGIRTHFYKLLKGMTKEAGEKAQLGLSHSYSRGKVKHNVNRADNMIIQGIALLDQLDKDVNTFSMRIREWYSYHFPELIQIVNDNYMYARVVHFIKDRASLDESKLEELEEIIGDSAKSQAVLNASRTSMGMEISPIDLINIEAFAKRVMNLANYRKKLHTYLQTKMGLIAPNLTSLVGEIVAARLISHAGSLTNLAKFPASTVQILGAEKALFRALKTRGKTPKYGLLFHSTFIGRAGTVHKGRISRFLANKCSIASRIDSFSDFPNSIFGEKLKTQVEERLKFYESGDLPRKNVDVMKEALDESQTLMSTSMISEPDAENGASSEGGGGKKKKKKKNKKRTASEMEETTAAEEVVEEEEEEAAASPPKKKKKKNKSISA